MSIPIAHSPLISLAAFGLSLLMMGGFFGGEMARRGEVRKEIKDIQAQHKAILMHMDSVYSTAVAREKMALDQMDAIYNTLTTLTVQEGKTRTNINVDKDKVEKGKKDIASAKEELKKASLTSGFNLDLE